MIKQWIKRLLMMMNREVPTDTLIQRGMRVGKNFSRQQGCFLDPTHCYLIEIGDDVTMSVRVTLMAHDASTKKILGYTKIGQIHIGNHVFLGANAMVLPNVRIGDYSVIGAGSVVTQDIPAHSVAAGVPARVICTTEEFAEKNLVIMEKSTVFDASYRMNRGLTEEKKTSVRENTEGRIAFID